MVRELSWVGPLLWTTLLTIALLVSGVLVRSRLSRLRTQQRRASALRYHTYYANVLPLLYRYFDTAGSRTLESDAAATELPRHIHHLIAAHRDDHGPRTRAAFYVSDATAYPGKRSRHAVHQANLAYLDLLLAVLDDCAHQNRPAWLARLSPGSALSAPAQTELDRYRCLFLTWRLLDEYGWLDNGGSIAPLGMYEIRRLNQPGRRLDATLYRLLRRQRQPPGWERNWDDRARVEPSLERQLQGLLGQRPVTTPFLAVCTLVVRYAYANQAEGQAVMERIEASVQAYAQQGRGQA